MYIQLSYHFHSFQFETPQAHHVASCLLHHALPPLLGIQLPLQSQIFDHSILALSQALHFPFV